MKSTTAIAPALILGLVAGMTSSAGVGQPPPTESRVRRRRCLRRSLRRTLAAARLRSIARDDDSDDRRSRHHPGWGRRRRRGPRHHARVHANFTGCHRRGIMVRPSVTCGAPQHGQEPDFQALSGVTADHRPQTTSSRGTSFWRIRVPTTQSARSTCNRSTPASASIARRTIGTRPYQMSLGSGTIEGNTFATTEQPIRGPYDNSPAAGSL